MPTFHALGWIEPPRVPPRPSGGIISRRTKADEGRRRRDCRFPDTAAGPLPGRSRRLAFGRFGRRVGPAERGGRRGQGPGLDRGGLLRGGLLVGRPVLLAAVLSNFTRPPTSENTLNPKSARPYPGRPSPQGGVIPAAGIIGSGRRRVVGLPGYREAALGTGSGRHRSHVARW
jgi:hypothetical protein